MRSVAADEATVEAGTTYLLVVHAGAGVAIRDAGDGSRAAGDRHRAADHVGSSARGHPQHRAGAGADRGLGYRPCARRCRRGPGQFDRRPDRRADAARVFPQVRALCRLRARAMASAVPAMEAHPQCRSAGRRRVRDHLRLDGRDLLRIARFRRGGAGRFRHRHARARPHPDAGAGGRARRRDRSSARISAPATPHACGKPS